MPVSLKDGGRVLHYITDGREVDHNEHRTYWPIITRELKSRLDRYQAHLDLALGVILAYLPLLTRESYKRQLPL
jgi:hypothetical protein